MLPKQYIFFIVCIFNVKKGYYVFLHSINKALSPANDFRVLQYSRDMSWYEDLIEALNLVVGDLIRFQTKSAFLDKARIFGSWRARPFLSF
jgi:hypothetical protein